MEAGRPGKGSCRRLPQGRGASTGTMMEKGPVQGMFWRRAAQNFSIESKGAKRRGVKYDSLIFGLSGGVDGTATDWKLGMCRFGWVESRTLDSWV